jgi:hypothetical protein
MKSTVKWKYNKSLRLWSIEDRFNGFFVSSKLRMPRIRFEGRWTYLFPVSCEWTGEQIGWRTTVDKEWDADVTPAYLSFEVVDRKGKLKKGKS